MGLFFCAGCGPGSVYNYTGEPVDLIINFTSDDTLDGDLVNAQLSASSLPNNSWGEFMERVAPSGPPASFLIERAAIKLGEESSVTSLDQIFSGPFALRYRFDNDVEITILSSFVEADSVNLPMVPELHYESLDGGQKSQLAQADFDILLKGTTNPEFPDAGATAQVTVSIQILVE